MPNLIRVLSASLPRAERGGEGFTLQTDPGPAILPTHIAPPDYPEEPRRRPPLEWPMPPTEDDDPGADDRSTAD